MRASRAALCSLALVALVALATTAHAQGTGRPGGAGRPGMGGGAMMKQNMVADLERQKKNLLDYVNVAPDSVLRFRTTPGVRTYGQQIQHVAMATAGIIGNVLGAGQPPAAADTAQVHVSKAALAAYVTSSYDFAIKAVNDATPQAMMAEKTMFGMTRSGMRWVNGTVEHGAWTLGQTVPYLRMNGLTPPNYLPF